jgi:hypothetical protein
MIKELTKGKYTYYTATDSKVFIGILSVREQLLVALVTAVLEVTL